MLKRLPTALRDARRRCWADPSRCRFCAQWFSDEYINNEEDLPCAAFEDNSFDLAGGHGLSPYAGTADRSSACCADDCSLRSGGGYRCHCSGRCCPAWHKNWQQCHCGKPRRSDGPNRDHIRCQRTEGRFNVALHLFELGHHRCNFPTTHSRRLRYVEAIGRTKKHCG